ncbi:hypothetical protein DAPPUDRAFT_263557 [Daphnia pulex]|uniref:Uncharacterized protein n=1 Tax=Daphnia pulex TaxID=6669 RepID=E9HPZ6_DAPPU|nr:hypothetical protein DAPPUDRAFT_263557 [Daphnia pulex]|eukprot:EFX66184.1 hypothetical protein DAPPUDRAFT_263557 [Daphnia pulex]
MLAKAKVFSWHQRPITGIDSSSLKCAHAVRLPQYDEDPVTEQQAPGYLTRLETLTELQNSLASNASASASHMTTRSIPNQTHRLSKTDGATHKVNYGFTTSQHSQHVMTRQGTAKCDSLQTLKRHGSHRGGATKAANKFSAVQLQFVKQSLKVSGKELATTQQEISDTIKIKSNTAAITGSADAGKDLIVNNIEQIKVNDVAEETPSRKASTAADFIQKSSAVAAAGRKQTKQRSDRNDRDNTGGAFHIGNFGSKTSQYSQHGTVDGYRMATTNSAGASSNYSSGYYKSTASSRGLNQSNNQSAMTGRGTAEYCSPVSQKLKYGLDSKEVYSSDDYKDKKSFVATVKEASAYGSTN